MLNSKNSGRKAMSRTFHKVMLSNSLGGAFNVFSVKKDFRIEETHILLKRCGIASA